MSIIKLAYFVVVVVVDMSSLSQLSLFDNDCSFMCACALHQLRIVHFSALE